VSVDLKQKTVSGLTWNFTGNAFEKAISLVVGIILARLLTPREYGLVGMVTIFIVLTQPFINSGFSQALIRKQDCDQKDFSTVFYFNLFVGLLIYVILYFTAPFISTFFKEPQLTKLTRVIGTIVIIDAFTLIQTTILTKEINFKKLTQINIASISVSGVIGIYLAYKGFGVWSLVYRAISQHILRSAFLWTGNRWMPSRVFSIRSFKEMFGFGSNLLVTAIIDKLYYNIYNLVIAKFFSAKELGLYSRADMFKSLASTQISEIIAVVAFPALSRLQNEPERLSDNYKKILNSTMYVVLILLLIIAASAESLVLTLIGEKWIESVIYLQLLCFVGIFYPLNAMARTLLYVYGKGRLTLKLEIITKLFMIPAVLTGIFLGIKAMIVAMIIVSAAEYILKAFYSGRLIGYSVLSQFKDLSASFFIAISVGAFLLLVDHFIDCSIAVKFILQIGLGTILTVSVSEIFKIREYMFIKENLIDIIKGLLNKKS